METIMATPAIVPSTLEYLFHRIETKLKFATGPSIIVLDECWLFFDNPAFKDKLREYFKDMRKRILLSYLLHKIYLMWQINQIY